MPYIRDMINRLRTWRMENPADNEDNFHDIKR